MTATSKPRDDRVVVVTGASSGIGRLTARAFAERADRVVLAARTGSSLDEVARECEDVGGTALAVPTDVAVYDEVGDLARRAIEAFERIDVWVNGAAVIAYGALDEIPYDVHRRVIEVDLLGQLHGALVAVAQFKRQNAGVLVNVASLYGRMTTPFVAPYVVSKFGVLGLTEVLRQELAGRRHIHVCSVLPGSMDTPIFRHAADYHGRRPRPIPPVSDPRRVARAIVSLADRPRGEVTVGRVQQMLGWGQRLAPDLYGRLAPVAMRTAGWTRTGAEPSPGNVFEPMPEWNRSQGGWRHPVRRLAIAGLLTAGVSSAVVAVRRR